MAACDESLLGQKIVDGKYQLDLSSRYYNGERISEANLLGLIKKADILNFVGTEATRFLVNNGIIEQGDIKKIKDVPYSQVVLIRSN